MPDIEKVIKGLREHIRMDRHCVFRFTDCPYVGDCKSGDGLRLFRDALTLLEADRPHLVTEADFEGADDDGFIPVWVEEIKTGNVYCDCVTNNIFEESNQEDYRFWTSRPRK